MHVVDRFRGQCECVFPSADSRMALKLIDPRLLLSLLSSLGFIKRTEARGSQRLNKVSYCVLTADQIREVMNLFQSQRDISPSSLALFLCMQYATRGCALYCEYS